MNKAAQYSFLHKTSFISLTSGSRICSHSTVQLVQAEGDDGHVLSEQTADLAKDVWVFSGRHIDVINS
jgi:hypothetical protein